MKYLLVLFGFSLSVAACAADYVSFFDATGSAIKLVCDTDELPSKVCQVGDFKQSDEKKTKIPAQTNLVLVKVLEKEKVSLLKSLEKIEQIYALKKMTLTDEDAIWMRSSSGDLGACYTDQNLYGLIVVCSKETKPQKLLIFMTGACDNAACQTLPIVLKKVN